MLVDLVSTTPLKVGEGLAGKVALAQKPKYVCDLPTSELANHIRVEFAPWLEQYPVDSLYAAPLCSHAQLIGTLQIVRIRPGSPITPEEQSFYFDLATRAALAIDNARLHMEVQHLAVTDSLTGLFNRRGFFQHGEIEIGRFQRYGHPLSIIMLDVDHFKSINDTYGHAFGDEVLKVLGHNCTAHVRQTDIVSRLGGDEFIILLPETGLETAYTIAKRIHECFGENQFSTPVGPIQLTASFGVTAAWKETKNLESLISRADQALYEAKQKGRNQVQMS